MKTVRFGFRKSLWNGHPNFLGGAPVFNVQSKRNPLSLPTTWHYPTLQYKSWGLVFSLTTSSQGQGSRDSLQDKIPNKWKTLDLHRKSFPGQLVRLSPAVEQPFPACRGFYWISSPSFWLSGCSTLYTDALSIGNTRVSRKMAKNTWKTVNFSFSLTAVN